MCILCRKKQELLSKTGQWINKAAEADGFIRPHLGTVSLLITLNKLEQLEETQNVFMVNFFGVFFTFSLTL